VLADSYPFWGLMGTMLVFFLWLMWFWLLFEVFADVFRRHDISGWGKTAWLIVVIILPFLGVFIYLISQNKGMRERGRVREATREATRGYYGSDSAAAEIESGRKLLDSGAITLDEFNAIKQKALA
jgi:Phospholipase_D-nuclease N-terminal